jgi:hypothetical protein
LQQQQLMQHQRQQALSARQALMQQQYAGMQMGVPNGMGQISQAQYAAMRAGGPMARSVNLPQHLQHAQQQAQQSLEQQQAQQQQHVSSQSRDEILPSLNFTLPSNSILMISASASHATDSHAAAACECAGSIWSYHSGSAGSDGPSADA